MRMLTSPASLVVLLSGLLVGGLVSGSAAADDPKPCLATSFKIAKVEAACNSGGQDKVKTMMKAAVKKAKAAGESMTCKSCHNSLKTYDLKGDDPVGEIKKWL